MPNNSIDPTIVLDPLDLTPAIGRIASLLGLTRPSIFFLDQLLRYAQAIESSGMPGCSASMQADRLGTARHLLRRRDEALLAGWDGVAPSTPALADLARIETHLRRAHPTGIRSLADRIQAIERALTNGQVLTVGIRLLGDAAAFPARIRGLLPYVATSSETGPLSLSIPSALPNSSLGRYQASMLGTLQSVTADASLGVVSVGSLSAAALAITAMLASRSASDLASTVIVCQQADLLVALDDRLRRCGFPVLGAPSIGHATALDGVLPVALGLCWEPVDAELLLEFCMLPGGPLGRKVGPTLGEALTRFPGLGSRSWLRAVEQLMTEQVETDQPLSERLATWFDHARVRSGISAPAALLVERCRVVAQWGGRRSAVLPADQDNPFAPLAGAAARLAEAIELAGVPQSLSNLARMIAESAPGSATPRFLAEAGGALLVATPGEVPPNTRRVIWVNPVATDPLASCWTGAEWIELTRAGLSLDDGSARAAARRLADRAGLLRISDALTVIDIASDEDQRHHPAMITLREAMKIEGGGATDVPRLDDVTTWPSLTVAGWRRDQVTATYEPPQARRLLWEPPASPLPERSTASFSDLNLKLSCPLAWSLKYLLHLQGGPAAALPADNRLQGTFAHAVLEHVFAGDIPDPALAAAAADQRFDERISIDAAPLTRAGLRPRLQRLKRQVSEAARTLATALRAAGCTAISMEAPIQASPSGIALSGSIDCVATGPGLAVVVDVKLGKLGAFRESIEQGRAVQLAVYAASRSESQVYSGYYIIDGPRLLTAGTDPIPGLAAIGAAGESVPNGPGWRQTWNTFTAALLQDRGWHQGQQIPARPLTDAATWPPGSDLVLDASEDNQSVCTYCDYKVLCGRAERR